MLFKLAAETSLEAGLDAPLSDSNMFALKCPPNTPVLGQAGTLALQQGEGKEQADKSSDGGLSLNKARKVESCYCLSHDLEMPGNGRLKVHPWRDSSSGNSR